MNAFFIVLLITQLSACGNHFVQNEVEREQVPAEPIPSEFGGDRPAVPEEEVPEEVQEEAPTPVEVPDEVVETVNEDDLLPDESTETEVVLDDSPEEDELEEELEIDVPLAPPEYGGGGNHFKVPVPPGYDWEITQSWAEHCSFCGSRYTDWNYCALSHTGGCCRYGYDFNLPGHADAGVPVVATDNGLIAEVDYSSGWGNYVLVEHQDNVCSRYAHMTDGSTDHLEEGMTACQGLRLGAIGETGEANGSHLHFQFEDCETGETLPIGFDDGNGVPYCTRGSDVYDSYGRYSFLNLNNEIREECGFWGEGFMESICGAFLDPEVVVEYVYEPVVEYVEVVEYVYQPVIEYVEVVEYVELECEEPEEDDSCLAVDPSLEDWDLDISCHTAMRNSYCRDEGVEFLVSCTLINNGAATLNLNNLAMSIASLEDSEVCDVVRGDLRRVTSIVEVEGGEWQRLSGDMRILCEELPRDNSVSLSFDMIEKNGHEITEYESYLSADLWLYEDSFELCADAGDCNPFRDHELRLQSSGATIQVLTDEYFMRQELSGDEVRVLEFGCDELPAAVLVHIDNGYAQVENWDDNFQLWSGLYTGGLTLSPSSAPSGFLSSFSQSGINSEFLVHILP